MYLSKFILRLNSNTFTSSVADTAMLSNTQFRSSLPDDKERERANLRVSNHKVPESRRSQPASQPVSKRVASREQQTKPIYIGLGQLPRSVTARLSESPPPYVTRTRTCPQATQDGVRSHATSRECCEAEKQLPIAAALQRPRPAHRKIYEKGEV